MPIYAYRCSNCGCVTDAYASINAAPERIDCEHCHRQEAHRIIARVAYHASDNAKTARLDPKYEKMVDDSMRKSSNADPDRLLKKMKPFSSAND